ncbi:hypothetical protein L6R53_12405 [Myxococcota bacterium]|nr:hypothetical protein [Myxococcota bacterium]
MNLAPDVRPRFEELLREPLGDTGELRQQVAAFAADARRRATQGLDLDTDLLDCVEATLESMLKRVSRKTTPLHHRLIHATARFCCQGPDQGRPLDDRRLATDVSVVNECARVIRRPELSIRR